MKNYQIIKHKLLTDCFSIHTRVEMKQHCKQISALKGVAVCALNTQDKYELKVVVARLFSHEEVIETIEEYLRTIPDDEQE